MENLIKTHNEQRNEILTRLEKLDITHNDIKNNNLQILNLFHAYIQNWIYSNPNQNLNFNNNYLRYVGMGIWFSSFIIFGYKFIKKN